jgi:hypothetical protein
MILIEIISSVVIVLLVVVLVGMSVFLSCCPISRECLDGLTLASPRTSRAVPIP